MSVVLNPWRSLRLLSEHRGKKSKGVIEYLTAKGAKML